MKSVDETIKFLNQNRTLRQRDRVIKSGMPEQSVIGAPKKFVNQAAKKIGPNQPLAEDLWRTGLHEARLLAILIAVPNEFNQPQRWITELGSWGITDQFARYLLPKLTNQDSIIQTCAASDLLYPKRLAFAGIACCISNSTSEDNLDTYFQLIRNHANDSRTHIKKALLWALVAIGKSSDRHREAAYQEAMYLSEQDKPAATLGSRAKRELEQLIEVPERKRLLSRMSKTGRKHS